MSADATNKFWSLVMTGLADVDGFRICIQVCMWLDFRPLIVFDEEISINSLNSFFVVACPKWLLQIQHFDFWI